MFWEVGVCKTLLLDTLINPLSECIRPIRNPPQSAGIGLNMFIAFVFTYIQHSTLSPQVSFDHCWKKPEQQIRIILDRGFHGVSFEAPITLVPL